MTRTRLAVAAVAAAALIGSVVAANYVTARYGQVPAGFGLRVTAGTYLAGAALILRDAVHRNAGRWAAATTIAVGATVSYTIAPVFLATASAIAFLVAELADLAVFDRIEARGRVALAVALSGLVGAVIDSFLFLHLARFPITTQTVGGQVLVKAGMSLLAAALIVGVAASSTSGTRPVEA